VNIDHAAALPQYFELAKGKKEVNASTVRLQFFDDFTLGSR
jgi:hypothetical protein